MEKRSKAYPSESARAEVRELYSGHNDQGLWQYALDSKAIQLRRGASRVVASIKLRLAKAALRFLDEIPDSTLKAVDRISAADAGQMGKFYSI